MAFREISAWIIVAAALAVGGWHFWQLEQAGGMGAAGPVIPAVGLFVVIVVVAHIAAGALRYRTAGREDERDNDIERRGEVIGGLLLGACVIGIGALALMRGDWLIANMAFAALLLSELGKGLTQIWLYRTGA